MVKLEAQKQLLKGDEKQVDREHLDHFANVEIMIGSLKKDLGDVKTQIVSLTALYRNVDANFSKILKSVTTIANLVKEVKNELVEGSSKSESESVEEVNSMKMDVDVDVDEDERQMREKIVLDTTEIDFEHKIVQEKLDNDGGEGQNTELKNNFKQPHDEDVNNASIEDGTDKASTKDGTHDFLVFEDHNYGNDELQVRSTL